MQEQASLPIGVVVRGQYVIEDLLGRSNSGVTYLVRNQDVRGASGDLFVLKEVVEPDTRARQRMVAVGNLRKQLRLRGLPRVHQVVNDDKNNRVYLLMDYIVGQDLETLRQQQPEQRFSWSKTLSIIAPIIPIVSSLHCQRSPIIHGDIKLANMVLPWNGIGAVLVDCWMGKVYDPGSAANRYCYRAPEQYSGEVDVRADVYALGASCYTMVTGKLPPDALSRLAHRDNGEIDPLETVDKAIPAVPMRISKAIDRAMALDVQHRFPSIELFWEALWSLVEYPALESSMPSVSTSSPVVPVSESEQAMIPTAAKPTPEPVQATPPLEDVEEQKDAAVAQSLPEPLPDVPLPEGIREQKEPDVAEPLPELSLIVPSLERNEEEEPESIEAPFLLPKLPAASLAEHTWVQQGSIIREPSQEPPLVLSLPESAKEQAHPAVAKHLLRLSAVVPSTISLKKLGMLFIILVLLISLGMGAAFFSQSRSQPTARSSTPSPITPSATPSPTTPSPSTTASSPYPGLAGTYNGTIYDLLANVSTNISLTNIRQSQGSFTGRLIVGPKLHGGGLFSGTIDMGKHLQFTVVDAKGNVTLFFEGAVQSATTLSGNYYSCSPDQGSQCHQVPGSYGIWSLAQTS